MFQPLLVAVHNKVHYAVTVFALYFQYERLDSIPEAGTVRERLEEDIEREDKVCPQALWGDVPDPGPHLLSPDKHHYQKQVQTYSRGT